MFFLDHIWIIPLLPAFGAAMMFFFGRKMQKATVNVVCVGVIVLAFLMSVGTVWQYADYAHDVPGKPFETILYTWLGSDTGNLNYVTQSGAPAEFKAEVGFLLDPLSSIWLLFAWRSLDRNRDREPFRMPLDQDELEVEKAADQGRAVAQDHLFRHQFRPAFGHKDHRAAVIGGPERGHHPALRYQ